MARTYTILLIDNDRSIADGFAQALQLEGYSTFTALSGEAGLELAESVSPDAIILDMKLPGLNGLEVLRELRSRRHPTSVAVLTGDYLLSADVMAELKALGAFVRFKPLLLEDLTALARDLVSTSQE